MKMTVAWFIVAGLALGCGRNPQERKATGEFIGVKGFENVEGKAKLEEAPPGVSRTTSSRTIDARNERSSPRSTAFPA